MSPSTTGLRPLGRPKKGLESKEHLERIEDLGPGQGDQLAECAWPFSRLRKFAGVSIHLGLKKATT
jgi:hypothetical protein